MKHESLPDLVFVSVSLNAILSCISCRIDSQVLLVAGDSSAAGQAVGEAQPP